MPHGVAPRHGSMQFWPRKRAKRSYALVKRWTGTAPLALGFAGYKVGMTHLMITDNRSTSETKGEDIFCPVTILECPPIKVASIRFYKNSHYGPQPYSQINADNLDKELARKVSLPKKQAKKIEDVAGYDDIRLIVYTQPKLTGIGKKKPELFELPIGGKLEDKVKYAKEKLGKEIAVNEIFKEGEQLDTHSVTKGHGITGPVRRFGIGRTSHKSEKHTRNPGSLGGWSAQGHVMYRVAHAGQTGYHQRAEMNKQIIKIGINPQEVQEKGGFIRYGVMKNTYLLVKGSLGGAKTRMIILTHARLPDKNAAKDAPKITYISTESKQ